MNITVLGAGAWGTAIAAHAARRGEVVLWARDAAQAAEIGRARCNARYLPGLALPETLRVTDDFDAAAGRASGDQDILVLGVPLSGLAETCAALARRRVPPRNIVWLCKGFDATSGAMPHQIVATKFAGLTPAPALAVLSGPSFAREVAQGLPCALTVASADAALRALVQRAFHHHGMRVYGSDDIVGVEVGGALKNIMAIAAGACDGLGLGLNARAALVTRGLAEMTRLGVVLGGKAETFMGLTGIGDLLLTATGNLSRNRTVGLQLAEGRSLQQILDGLGHVAEGVRCARAVRELARASGVDMPITEAVCAVLFDGMPAAEAVSALLSRDARTEAA